MSYKMIQDPHLLFDKVAVVCLCPALFDHIALPCKIWTMFSARYAQHLTNKQILLFKHLVSRADKLQLALQQNNTDAQKNIKYRVFVANNDLRSTALQIEEWQPGQIILLPNFIHTKIRPHRAIKKWNLNTVQKLKKYSQTVVLQEGCKIEKSIKAYTNLILQAVKDR